MQGAASVQVNVDASGYGNFAFPDQGINFSAGNYRWVHIWVKPLTEGSWVSFHCWDSTKAGWRDMNGDKNGDKLFAANEDLELNQWNELWVDLDRNTQGYVGGTVRGVHMHASPGAILRFDGIYTCSRNWSTYYYHTDYLNSPRAMTDADGNVVWRQDYLAFGSEAGTVATGNTHKFTGHIQDAATGQYYAKARFFTTALGRFSQPDPALKGPPGNPQLCNPQLLNPYVYCVNNPLKFNDPSGMVLELAGDLDETKKTLGEIAGKDASALGYNKDGTVTVTATAEQLANNEGLRTIANIAGATEKYQFAVSAEANSNSFGAINESVTKRMEFSTKWATPPAGYAGRTVVASKGSWNALDGSGKVPRMAIAFHELTEVFARSNGKGMYYENVVKNKDGGYGPTSPRSGAHPYAIEREKIWQTQGAVGNNFNGAAQYVP